MRNCNSNNMRNLLNKFVAPLILVLLLAAGNLGAQNKIDATILVKSGANSTFLQTNASGAVVWGTAQTSLVEGPAIDITGNQISVDPTGLTSLGATPDAADYFMVYDVSTTTLKKVTYAELFTGITFTMSDGTNTQAVANGQTFTFVNAGTDGFDFTVGATRQVTFNYDFTELTALGGALDPAADLFIVYDASASNYKTVLGNALGTNFTISDGTNTQPITGGNTLLFADAANGIDPLVGATDQVTFDLDVNELTTETVIDYTLDFVPYYDASAGAERKVTLGNLTKAPTDANVAIAVNTAANANIASGLTLANYRKVVVYLDGVRQRQTTDWVISTNNIQFTFATLAGQTMTVVGYP